MTAKWVYQPPYSSSRATYVRGSWQFREYDKDSKKSSYRHPCPVCGEEIISIRMKNGGWAHYFGAKGMTRFKHPCLHRLEGYSNAADELTFDLFSEGTARSEHSTNKPLPGFSVG